MRKTKIVCTIGPASESKEVLTGLCKAGMNVARLNFSHSTHEEHQRRINMIKSVREELSLPIAIMLDTKGPEYRIKTFEKGKITLNDGDDFIFTTDDVIGDNRRVSVSYSRLTEELNAGDTILLNNGLLSFEVTEISGSDIKCKVVIGGELSDRKSMSFPGKVMKQEYLSEQDKMDIKFGVENGIDYIACSFVSTKQDLTDVHDYLKTLGADHIELIAKIENQSGVDNIDEICKVCDGIMVARGDMGVEIPFEQLPIIQKKLITKCRLLGKRVITATEMLESMITNPRPTRAEISDIANAVYDGTSAIMLSGETAAGKYPIQAVATMAKIAETTESGINYKKRFYNSEFEIRNMVDAISHSTCGMAIDIGAKAVVACSLSGMTARMVSRFRSPVDIIGLTTNENTWRKLALSWGVIPAMCEEFTSTDVLFYTAKKIAKSTLGLSKSDKIVITGGDTTGRSGTTNLIKIEEI
ncbi:MAG: pyruvate kinase [Clostridia bacterium]|nr:pyruvate kinase [Clostridia bacterium]MBO5316303.1 pyruvate kinase [Clostridia bacterium]MBR3805846.1 pyruvate kinase [Clostridia bacterium]